MVFSRCRTVSRSRLNLVTTHPTMGQRAIRSDPSSTRASVVPLLLGLPAGVQRCSLFAAVLNNSGFFGNLGRNIRIGLGAWDSLMKDTQIHERMTIRFRAEL